MSYQYAAPEQILGEKVSHSTDIWAVGILIYKIMTGDLPYTSAKSEGTAQQMDIAGQIKNAPIPEKIKQIPAPYREIVEQCLIKNKDERPNATTSLLQLLENNKEVVVVVVVPEIIIPAKTVVIKKKEPINDFCEMVYVKGGNFMMGDESIKNAKPVHKVTLNNFHIGKYPVTQKQWVEIMGNNPSHFKGNDNHPVEQVSWDDSQEFIKKLNKKTGQNYRLPTESEWEYAARGGQKSKGYKYAGSDDVNEVTWCGIKRWFGLFNSEKSTYPIGQKKSNELEIYDMSGNVWEWCKDGWYDNYKNKLSDVSALIDEKNSDHIRRGGSWVSYPSSCRVTYRAYYSSHDYNDNLGFRLASQ
jgi:formylglycine-generating enzyme required for sulfatase activity